MVGTNCYLVYREDLKRAVIVDPGDNGAHILNTCRECGIIPEAVVLTHGHFDHILAVEEIRRAFKEITVYAAEKEAKLLGDPRLNLTASYGTGVTLSPDHLVKDGDILELAGFKWQVIETPGHTEGSVCLWIKEEEVLISGDTLFAESLGRTDFPTGSSADIIRSIKERLFVLPDDTMVYPGHGEPTTIGHEKTHNPVAFYNR
ncbi:metallo-beta-lactamase domain protein [Hungatella hathewayi DSM 13479]|uniref:Metallo-beta-lactamase domain protein n=2 Tax=Hungatella hathewayi TaxID=154046 RepID=D3AMJ8_9FIRM|nr:metallo-beta-lactamase domain protein [Hungatella hathewayi DSM 13479]